MPVPISPSTPTSSAVTFDDLITRVRRMLRSYTGQHERGTHLTAACTATDTELAVADGAVVAVGMVEIGDELVWVDSTAGGTLTVPPYGRGYSGTDAAAHASGTQVIADPMFPRREIADAIVDTQRSLWPTLWRPYATEITPSGGASTYEIPDDRVLSVAQKQPGPSGAWRPIRRFRVDNHADPAAYPAGRAITLLEAVHPGQPIRVVTAAPFTEFTSPTDTLLAAGHEASHTDLLCYGAAFRLVQFLEVSRLSMGAVENQERARFVASGAASALTRQLVALFERRLEQERDRLRNLHPLPVRYTR